MSKEITLPKAEATAELSRSPIISVSSREVSLEGKRIISTEEAMSSEVSDLVDLTYGLQVMRKTDQMMHPGVQFRGAVILQCDQGVQFTVVRKIMYAAAQAGYADVNYAVLSKRATIGETK